MSLVIRPYRHPEDKEDVCKLFAEGMWDLYPTFVLHAFTKPKWPILVLLACPLLAYLLSWGKPPYIRLLAVVLGTSALPVALAVAMYRALGFYVNMSLKDDLANIPKAYPPPSAFWVAELEGQILGTVGLQKKSETLGELRRMSVRRNLRRSGVGTRLARELIKHAHAIGLRRVFLGTSSAQIPALALYRKLGWEAEQVAIHGVAEFHKLTLNVESAVKQLGLAGHEEGRHHEEKARE